MKKDAWGCVVIIVIIAAIVAIASVWLLRNVLSLG